MLLASYWCTDGNSVVWSSIVDVCRFLCSVWVNSIHTLMVPLSVVAQRSRTCHCDELIEGTVGG